MLAPSKNSGQWSLWVAQSVKCLTLGFSSGQDPRVRDGAPCQAPCSAGSPLEILSLPLPLPTVSLSFK